MSSTAERELVLERVFDAPRALVFTVWTDARHVAQWWGPDGFTTTVHEMDVRPGGVWRFVLHAPDGTDYPNLVRFTEVSPPERLVYWHGAEDGSESDSFEVTITFADEGAQTRLTLRQLYATVEAREYAARVFHAVEMGKQTLDKFAAYLATVS